MWTAVAQWLRCCATNRKVAGSIPGCVSGFFVDIKSFRSHYGPGVDSASNRNEYREYFLGGKGGRCVRLTTYHHPVPLSRNLGTLTSWNPPGPVQACNGTALPFYAHEVNNVIWKTSSMTTTRHKDVHMSVGTARSISDVGSLHKCEESPTCY